MSRKHTQFLNDVCLLLILSFLPMILGMSLGIYTDFKIRRAWHSKTIMGFFMLALGPYIFYIFHYFSVNIKDMGASIVFMSLEAAVVGFIFSGIINPITIEYEHRVFIMVICVAITALIILLVSVMAPKIRQVILRLEEFSSIFLVALIITMTGLLFRLKNISLWFAILFTILAFYSLFFIINKIYYIAEGYGDDEDTPIYIALYALISAGGLFVMVTYFFTFFIPDPVTPLPPQWSG